MGLFSGLKKAFKKICKGVGDVVGGVAKGIGDVVGGAVKGAGKVVKGVFTLDGGEIVDGFGTALKGVVKGVEDIGGGVAKGVGNIVSGAIGIPVQIAKSTITNIGAIGGVAGGALLGLATLGPAGAVAGAILGGSLGHKLDKKLFGEKKPETEPSTNNTVNPYQQNNINNEQLTNILSQFALMAQMNQSQNNVNPFGQTTSSPFQQQYFNPYQQSSNPQQLAYNNQQATIYPAYQEPANYQPYQQQTFNYPQTYPQQGQLTNINANTVNIFNMVQPYRENNQYQQVPNVIQYRPIYNYGNLAVV